MQAKALGFNVPDKLLALVDKDALDNVAVDALHCAQADAQSRRDLAQTRPVLLDTSDDSGLISIRRAQT